MVNAANLLLPRKTTVHECAAMKVLHRKTLIDKKESWTHISGRPSLRLWAKLPHLVVFLTCIILLGVTIQM